MTRTSPQPKGIKSLPTFFDTEIDQLPFTITLSEALSNSISSGRRILVTKNGRGYMWRWKDNDVATLQVY